MSGWTRHPDGTRTNGDMIVWRFRGWNVAEGWTAQPDGTLFPDRIVGMDYPTMRDALTLADAHAAGRIDLAQHLVEISSERLGSKTWGRGGGVYGARYVCSCGATERTDDTREAKDFWIEHLNESMETIRRNV